MLFSTYSEFCAGSYYERRRVPLLARFYNVDYRHRRSLALLRFCGDRFLSLLSSILDRFNLNADAKPPHLDAGNVAPAKQDQRQGAWRVRVGTSLTGLPFRRRHSITNVRIFTIRDVFHVRFTDIEKQPLSDNGQGCDDLNWTFPDLLIYIPKLHTLRHK